MYDDLNVIPLFTVCSPAGSFFCVETVCERYHKCIKKNYMSKGVLEAFWHLV